MNKFTDKSSVKKIAVSPMYYLGNAVWGIVRFFFLLGMTFIILYPIIYMLSILGANASGIPLRAGGRRDVLGCGV